MAALNFDSLYRSTRKGDLAPVTYLTGDEDVLKDEIIRESIDAALEPSCRDFNLDVRSAGDLNPEQLIALVDTPPMLAERRVVVIRSLEQWRKNSRSWKALQKYSLNPSPSTVLLLLHRAGGGHKDKPDTQLAKNTRYAEITRLAPHRLGGWISRLAEKAEISITEEATAHLASVVGSNLAQLATEIDKLAASAGPEKEVTRRDVEVMVGVNHGETVDDWMRAVVTGDIGRAVSLLDHILPQPGVTGVRLVSNLGTVFVGIRYARALLDDGKSERQTESGVFAMIKNARPWGIGNWKTEASAWTEAARKLTARSVEDTLRILFETDRALKSTTVTGERGKLVNMLLEIGTTTRDG